MDGAAHGKSPPYGRVRRFIVEHEDRWTFIILYVGLAVALSVWLSLFWLLVLLAIHVTFEIITMAPKHRGARVAGEVAWAVKLDVALLLFAFALALYLDYVFGLLGLRAAAQGAAMVRGGARVGARAAGWSRGIRSTLLTADDAVQIARAARKGKAVADPEDDSSVPSWRQRWRTGQWVTLGLLVVSAALVLLSPVLTDHTTASALESLRRELEPIP